MLRRLLFFFPNSLKQSVSAPNLNFKINNKKRNGKMTENIETKTKITDLNNECFIKICRYLDWNDLLGLKLAHNAFDDAIDFIARTTEFEFIITSGNISKFESFVELFGRKIKWLKVRFYTFDDGEDEDDDDEWMTTMNYRVEFFIEKYCVNGNIKHCSFNGFKLRKFFFIRNISFFNCLETFELIDSTKPNDIKWLMDFISKNKNMQEFYLFYVSDADVDSDIKCDILYSIASSHLKKFWFSDTIIGDLYCKPNKLPLPMNYTLKDLCIDSRLYDPVLLTYFPNIECVRNFYSFDDSYLLDPFLTLPELKWLELHFEELGTEFLFSFLTKLADRNSLEYFSLNEEIMARELNDKELSLMANNLCKMTNLKKLEIKFYDTISFEKHLPRIGNCLKNLQDLNFHGGWKFGNLDEQKKNEQIMLDFVKMAKNLTVLECSLADHLNKTELCDKLIKIRKEQGNSKILYLRGASTIGWPMTEEMRKYIRVKDFKRRSRGIQDPIIVNLSK